MKTQSVKSHVLLAGALIAMPVAAGAQNEVTDQANAVAEQAEALQQEANQLTNVAAEETQLTEDTAAADVRQDDDDDFDWGLLGLLGLAGLLGLKRNERRDVHVDNRRDNDPSPRV